MSTPPFRSYARVSLDRIAANFGEFRRVVGPRVDVLAVVKANAYGHGAMAVARRLIAEGAGWLAVATVEEGIGLREQGIAARILVMGGHLPYEREALAPYDLTTVVHSLAEIDALEKAALPVRFHLKIDSGMGRLGTCAPADEIVDALRRLRTARCEGLMTHFAAADDFTTDQTERQLAQFARVHDALQASGLEIRTLHVSSTAAVAYGCRRGWQNMVRAGLGLYGYVPPAEGAPPERLLRVAPALEWKAKLLAVKDLPAGATVGYGASFRATASMRIGVVGAGYADGVFRQLSNRGSVIADARLTPILGRVSMDVTTIDLSHTERLREGDEVTLIGQEGDVTLDAQQVAEQAGTISYHVLCAIGARVPRVYEALPVMR